MSTSRMKRKKKTASTKSINAPLRVIKGCCVESSDITDSGCSRIEIGQFNLAFKIVQIE